MLKVGLISAKVPCIIGVGGSSNSIIISTGNKVLIKNSNIIPSLPIPTGGSSSGSNMIEHDKAILFCGGYNSNSRNCVQLVNSQWKKHSTLKQKRCDASIVSTNSAIYIFGGSVFPNTYEYLLKNSNEWQMGKTEIPEGFKDGCAISVRSGREIWLFGGWDTPNRILSFDVDTHTFKQLPQTLKSVISRKYGHRCAYIPGTNKVIITGGATNGGDTLNSTEIIDTDTGTVIIGSPMNSRRSSHGIGIISIDNRERLVVFGGHFRGMLDSVEFYNAESHKWEPTNIKLNGGQCMYSFVNTKLGNII